MLIQLQTLYDEIEGHLKPAHKGDVIASFEAADKALTSLLHAHAVLGAHSVRPQPPPTSPPTASPIPR